MKTAAILAIVLGLVFVAGQAIPLQDAKTAPPAERHETIVVWVESHEAAEYHRLGCGRFNKGAGLKPIRRSGAIDLGMVPCPRCRP